MDWSNLSHVMQALIVVGCFIVFMMGYAAGERV